MAQHPIIWKEVNKLFAKDATEPLPGGTGLLVKFISCS